MMKKITNKRQLNELLKSNTDDVIKDISFASANLKGANLSNRKFLRCTFDGADLDKADLSCTTFSDCGMRGATFRMAVLSYTEFKDITVANCCFNNAHLGMASFRNQSVSASWFLNACVGHMDLTNAWVADNDFGGVDLSTVKCRKARFCGNKFSAETVFPAPAVKLPPFGKGFDAWKKVYGDFVLKLWVPNSARRVSTPIDRKCRVDKAVVISAFNSDGTPTSKKQFKSMYNEAFIYDVGNFVEVTEFNDDPLQPCRPGIHVFKSFKEASKYVF